MSVTAARPLTDRALDVLRRAGNPFCNYFARNPDDEVCARYHVPELYQRERSQLLAIVDLYRYDARMHSEVVPVLGNKGSGKTHLLYSIKHGAEGAWQMLVTPGVYQKDSDFLEYLLFQVIDTLLGGGIQKGARPLTYVGEELTRRVMRDWLHGLSAAQRLDLFPASGLGRWARRLGLGSSQAQERTQWLFDNLGRTTSTPSVEHSCRRLCEEVALEPASACEQVLAFIQRTQPHSTAGLMRTAIYQGFVRSALLGDESELASFLTYGFAELDFNIQPTRQDLVLALFKVLMEVFRGLKAPVVVAFDQLEDLLLARREDASRIAEAFFAGIVQAMHQLDGICFLIFAERGLWNRFVPSLDGYIQDRLNNPINVPDHGALKTLRLEAPPVELVRQVVVQRLRPALAELSGADDLGPLHPFTEEQVLRIARTEPTLRDMLQQFRQLYDHVVYGKEEEEEVRGRGSEGATGPEVSTTVVPPASVGVPAVKSVVVVQTPVTPPPPSPIENRKSKIENPAEVWEQEVRAAGRKLEPDGALTGATRELQAGLGQFLQVCHEHGVKVGPWRLSHVTPEWSFGDHPTYGVLTIAHWVCKDGQPWKVGIGLFLGRGSAKPKDLAIKMAALEIEPAVIDHLILLRPEDDFSLSGRTKSLWQDAEKRGRHLRLEAATSDALAVLYSFPRWLAVLTESLPVGQELPNLADLIQERCERLLEQVCMPA
jgi:hypothetical protein